MGLAEERRRGDRYVLAMPVRVEWKDQNGEARVEEGLTENIGASGTLIHLPRELPDVGTRVNLYVIDEKNREVAVGAEVLRLERNAAHPQAALELVDSVEKWQKKLYDKAPKRIAALHAADDYEDF
jgi:hypothetical protein